jgi:DNA-binding transcriptional ArsR family regulator
MSIDDRMDRVFKALANGVRRSICDELRLRPLTTKQLCAAFPELDRCTVMQHLGVLERAGLVVAARKGRERFNYLDAMPIEEIHRRWIGPHAAGAASRLLELKETLENSSVRPELVEGPSFSS